MSNAPEDDGRPPQDPPSTRDPPSPRGALPPLDGIHEAALYVSDLERAREFWERLDLKPFARAEGRHLFFRVGRDVLLVFDPRGTIAGGSVPGHGALGPGHVALSVPDAAALEEWRGRLESAGVEVEVEAEWPSGGRSIYFRDPDGNSLELITRGSWGPPRR